MMWLWIAFAYILVGLFVFGVSYGLAPEDQRKKLDDKMVSGVVTLAIFWLPLLVVVTGNVVGIYFKRKSHK